MTKHSRDFSSYPAKAMIDATDGTPPTIICDLTDDQAGFRIYQGENCIKFESLQSMSIFSNLLGDEIARVAEEFSQ